MPKSPMHKVNRALGRLFFPLTLAGALGAASPNEVEGLWSHGSWELLSPSRWTSGGDGKETPALLFDTLDQSAPFTACARTRPGLLPAGAFLEIRVDLSLEESVSNGALLVLLRPLDRNDSGSDLGSAEISGKGIQSVSLRARISSSLTNLALQFHAKGRVRGRILGASVREGGGFSRLPLAVDSGAPLSLPEPVGTGEFTVDPPRLGAPPKVVRIEGLDPAAADNTAALQAAFDAAKGAGPLRLALPKGVYRFSAETSLRLENLVDVDFDGGGSELVFFKTKRLPNLDVRSNERLALRNFTMDWDWERSPLASRVEVASTSPDGEWIDLRFRLPEIFPSDLPRLATLETIDPANGSPAFPGAFSIGVEFTAGRSVAKTEWREKGTLLRWFPEPSWRKAVRERFLPGAPLRMRHYVYDMNGVQMSDNAHLTLSNLTLHGAAGHAFVTHGEQHHWQFRDVRIVPRGGRPITCTADHHHVASSKGFLKILGSEFSWGGDDCLNVHDVAVAGTRIGPRALRMFQDRDVSTLRVGDLFEFRTDDLSPARPKDGSRGEVVIALSKITRSPPGGPVLSFEADLPGKEDEAFVLWNRRFASGNVIVKNSTFHDHRARGLLLLAPNLTIESNHFYRNQGGAIKIETGFTLRSWSEGRGATNVVLRGNLFEDANATARYPQELEPVIYVSSYLRTDPSILKSPFPLFRDLLIENNRFRNNPGVSVWISSAENVTFRGNSVENPAPRGDRAPYLGGIGAAWARNLWIGGNEVGALPGAEPPALWMDPRTVEGVRIEGKR